MEIHLIRAKNEREVQSFRDMREGGSVGPGKGEDGVLKKREHIPAEKHELQNFVLIIPDSKSAMLPGGPLQLYSRQYGEVYHFLENPTSSILGSTWKSAFPRELHQL